MQMESNNKRMDPLLDITHIILHTNNLKKKQ